MVDFDLDADRISNRILERLRQLPSPGEARFPGQVDELDRLRGELKSAWSHAEAAYRDWLQRLETRIVELEAESRRQSAQTPSLPRAARLLPTVDGYSYDERLGEFRKVTYVRGQPSMEYVPVASTKGQQLLNRLYGREH
jgi:transcription elongation GreA/GreB family factor